MDNYNDYVNDYMNSYDCPVCNDTKLQSEKNARKINEVIEQVNALIQINNETVIGNLSLRNVLEGEIFILDTDTTVEPPVEPDEPVDPDEPDDPDEPVDPDNPDIPDEPDEPDEPVVPSNVRFMFESKNINSGSSEIISNMITATLSSPAVIVDGGLSLNKNSITIPHTSGLQNRPFTIEFTLKYDNSISNLGNSNYPLFDTRYGSGTGNGYRIGSFYIAGAGRDGYIKLAGALGVNAQLSDGIDFTDGVERTWKFIFTNSQVKTYIDGALNKTTNYTYQESQRDISIGDKNVNTGLLVKKFALYDGEVI